jgi:hypothetical protein
MTTISSSDSVTELCSVSSAESSLDAASASSIGSGACKHLVESNVQPIQYASPDLRAFCFRGTGGIGTSTHGWSESESACSSGNGSAESRAVSEIA